VRNSSFTRSRGRVELFHVRTSDCEAGDDEYGPEDQEPDVPRKGAAAVVSDVVDAEQLMVDEAFDEVKYTPPGEDQSSGTFPCGPMPAGEGAPQQEHSDESHDPGGEVEQPIPQRVVFQRSNGGRREGGVFAVVGAHVVPLEDLVQHDAVDETAESQAEQDPRGRYLRALPAGTTSMARPRGRVGLHVGTIPPQITPHTRQTRRDHSATRPTKIADRARLLRRELGRESSPGVGTGPTG